MLSFIFGIFHKSQKNINSAPKPLPPPINQYHLENRLNTYLGFFIDKNDKRESLPPEASAGLCNGYSLLLLRADILGERSKFLSRLHRIAESSDLKLKDTADLVAEFRAAFQQTVAKESSLDRQLFKIRIKSCKGNKKKIAALKNDRYENLKTKTIEAINLSKVEKELLEFGLDLYDFANSLVFAQSAFKAVQLKIFKNKRERPIKQNDILEILKVITPDNWKNYSLVFQLNFLFYDDEFVKTIETTIQNGDFVVISIKDHTMYLIKNNDKYILYNPNFKVDPIEFDSAHKLFFDIENGVRKCFFRKDEPVCMYEIEVLADPTIKGNNSRPSASDVLTTIFNMRSIKNKKLDIKNIDIDLQDSDGDTALNNSVLFNQLPIAKELIARGANPNISNKKDWFPLTRAANVGNNEMIRAILSSEKVKIDIAGDDTMTALHWATHSGHVKTVEILIANGANLNLSTKARGPAICIAASNNNIQIVKVLAESKADLTGLFSSYPAILIQILLQIENIKKLDGNSLKKFNEPETREKLLDAFIQYIKTITNQEFKKNILLSVIRKENTLGIIFNIDSKAENNASNSMLFSRKKTARTSSSIIKIESIFKDIITSPKIKLAR